MKSKQYQITVTDEDLDIIVTMLDLCCRSTQIIANDPKDPLSGLHKFERTPEERERARQIIQRIGKECL